MAEAGLKTCFCKRPTLRRTCFALLVGVMIGTWIGGCLPTRERARILSQSLPFVTDRRIIQEDDIRMDAPGPSDTLIWPMPAWHSRGDNDSVMLIDEDFYLVSAVESDILCRAFRRYCRMILKHSETWATCHCHGPHEPQALSILDRGLLQRIRIDVQSASEALSIDTDESYSIDVGWLSESLSNRADGAVINARTVFGAIRGLETFSQLCRFDYSSKKLQISNVPWRIRDSPRFKHRGLLVDTSRHFLPPPVIKQIIDSMAYSKLNVLHWHIVDDQSFPLEIPSFPRLWHGSYSSAERYTMDDVRHVVEYARLRGIHVMGELDVPGHASSWGIGYPELWPTPNCRSPLDVSKQFTFEVIDGILGEMAKLFRYKFIHIGGDEVDTACWSWTPHIQEWMEKNKMTATNAYEHFVLRVQDIALKHGYQPVNWEEAFSRFGGKLNPNTVVQTWISKETAASVVKAGFRCIVSNNDAWYLDHIEVKWETFYNNEPFEGIDDLVQQALIVGGEVCMWGETADASNVLQTIWPKSAAAAERLWSPRYLTSAGNMNDVKRRLAYFRCLLNDRGIPAAPLLNEFSRSAPQGPGSCYEQ